jgi:predicted amidohydrolase YtcJ
MRKLSVSAAFVVLLAGPATAFGGETAIYHVSGYTLTDSGVRQFQVLVVADDGRVVAAGDSALLDEHPDAVRIDGDGRTLLPGLIDAHGHVYELGELQDNLDVTGFPSLADTLRSLESYARAHPYSKWIVGRGWNQVLWPVREFPRAADIDGVVADRPVWLHRVDGHAGWANGAALEIAGIDDDTPDPPGGRIVRDANGVATGILVDQATDLVESHVPPPTKADMRRRYRGAITTLASVGLTGVHDAGITLEQAEVYLSMAADGELGLRVYAMLLGTGAALDAIGHPLHGLGNDHLDIAAVKLFADGALGSRGAALLEPYSDDPENRGLPYWTPAELTAMAQKANRLGFQVAVHAIGDRANRMVLDTFEAIQHGRPSPLRNRVEHAQVIALDDIPRFAELGVIASMQPTHATSDMNMAEDRIGPDRIRGAYAWRRLLDSGATLASGSDFPVESPNPFLGLYAAVTRQDRAGRPEGGWYADQALSRAEALYSFTLAAAYAAHAESRLGSLEPGKWADFIIIDRDYFSVPASEIDDIRVLETWVGGKRVYAASEGDQ